MTYTLHVVTRKEFVTVVGNCPVVLWCISYILVIVLADIHSANNVSNWCVEVYVWGECMKYDADTMKFGILACFGC